VKATRDALDAIEARLCVTCPAEGCATPGESDVLRVLCLPDDRVEVLTPVVVAQPDGIHIEALAPPPYGEIGVRSSAAPERTSWSGSSGLDAPFVRPIPEGDAYVWCIRGPQQAEPDVSLQGRFTVVDPADVFVPYSLECASAGQMDLDVLGERIDSLEGVDLTVLASPASVEDAVRDAVVGILPTDTVERAGYVRYVPGDFDWPYLDARIVRDGRVIGRFDIYGGSCDGQRNGYFAWFGYVCTDSGISVR
jgi:hypothetical protein